MGLFQKDCVVSSKWMELKIQTYFSDFVVWGVQPLCLSECRVHIIISWRFQDFQPFCYSTITNMKTYNFVICNSPFK